MKIPTHPLAAALAALGLRHRRQRPGQLSERPITMIVPFAAGGPTDVIARIVSDHMSRTLGQQIVVENVAGAGGTTGITRAAQAQPRRLHHHDGPHGHARRRARPLPEPQVRPDQGLRPDRARRRHADRDRRQEGLSGRRPQGLPRQRQGERAASSTWPMPASARSRTRPASCSTRRVGIKPTLVAYRGTGPGAERPDGQHGRLHDRPDRQRRAADHGRQHQGLRHRHARALAGPARRADHQGGGAARPTRSRPGTRSSRRRARRRRSRPSCRTPSRRRSTTRTPASACSTSAA